MSPLDYLDMQFGFRLSKITAKCKVHEIICIILLSYLYIFWDVSLKNIFPYIVNLFQDLSKYSTFKKYSKIKPVHLPKYSKEMLKIYWYNPLVRNCSTINLLEISLLVRKVINILQTLFKRNHVYYGIQTIYYLSN